MYDNSCKIKSIIVINLVKMKEGGRGWKMEDGSKETERRKDGDGYIDVITEKIWMVGSVKDGVGE